MKVRLSLDAVPIHQPSHHCSALEKNIIQQCPSCSLPSQAYMMAFSGSAPLWLGAIILESVITE